MQRSPSWEANIFQAVIQILRSLWNPIPVTACTRCGNSLCPKPGRFSPRPHPSSWGSTLILFSHLVLCLPTDLSHSVFRTKTPHYFTSTQYTPHEFPSTSLFDHANNIWCGVQITTLLIMQSSKFPLISSLSHLNSSPFSNILSLCSSLDLTDQVLH